MTEEPEELRSKAKKPVILEDLPGVGPTTADRLREAGFATIESLSMATIRELEPLGLGERQAEKIIAEARSSASLTFLRGDELLKLRENIRFLTSGSKALDELLGGKGIETQSITEFYGEYGTGKSQICHQLCVNVQLPTKLGGLEGGALYIDTENTFRIERITQMASHLGLDPSEILRGIVYAEAVNSDHQMLILEKADKWIKENNIRLIIIDSLTAHFRSEYLGREMLAERQQLLNKHMHRLIKLSRAFNTAAVVTNQVMAKPDTFFGEPLAPVGGHIVAHTSHTRVSLRRPPQGQSRIARLVSSPYLPEGERVFKVTENGIEDIVTEDR
ncbi:DNA repair and recombination protein RadA [Candidatus Bathyarchaeota archaeon RBG_16_48_13]|nr:MAG: DNA repair and recombination protein RadA [Candidatus Bathyarchaeota archaeon RBG_16_48_13]